MADGSGSTGTSGYDRNGNHHSCVTLFYQNGTNEKTKSAFAAVLITMTVLFFFIYMVVWRSETGGLNEIQAAEDDVLYYNMNLDINMRNVATAVIILSTLGAVLDMALTVTTSVYESVFTNRR